MTEYVIENYALLISNFGYMLSCFFKRSFDVVASVCGLIVLSPLFVLVASLVRRDGGAVIHVQKRVGHGGRLFKMYKFRSMHVGAEKRLIKYLSSNATARDEWNVFQKLKDDPRITSIGTFIRITSIDELPQLLNVLKGEMSLVGPRPFLPGQESYYGDKLRAYQSVRPGITGPWQVSGRNRRTFAERVALEAWYARNWTLWLDLVILLKTIPALFVRGTAY